jgi:hypothetical protein
MFPFKKKPTDATAPLGRRKHKRILYSHPVDLLVGQRVQRIFSRTLSAGGLHIAANLDLPVATVVRVRIGTESRGHFIDAQGSVVYSSGEGIGLKFVHISPGDQKKLQSIIDRSWWQEV